VKELYTEAMQDEELRAFLPELKVHTSKVQERDFFFGVLGTLKGEYLNALIQEAHGKRFKGERGGEEEGHDLHQGCLAGRTDQDAILLM